MNKEFIVKVIKAKQLEYEAFKEILPESIRKQMDNFQKDAVDLLKDVAFELIKDNVEKPKAEVIKTTKKVEVDFS